MNYKKRKNPFYLQKSTPFPSSTHFRNFAVYLIIKDSLPIGPLTSALVALEGIDIGPTSFRIAH